MPLPPGDYPPEVVLIRMSRMVSVVRPGTESKKLTPQTLIQSLIGYYSDWFVAAISVRLWRWSCRQNLERRSDGFAWQRD